MGVEGHTARGSWTGLELTVYAYRDGVTGARSPYKCHFRDYSSITSKTPMKLTYSISHRYPLRMVPHQNRYYHHLDPGSNQQGHSVVAHMQTRGKQQRYRSMSLAIPRTCLAWLRPGTDWDLPFLLIRSLCGAVSCHFTQLAHNTRHLPYNATPILGD